MRKCIEVVAQGLRLRGTVHVPPAGSAAAAGFEGLGVIILHPGFLPRSAQSDSAVDISDALAQKGILTVRMDLPGLGDSEGDLPADSFTFIDTVQEGGLAEVAGECVDRVKDQLGLRKVVIGGHCGGAITGFYGLASRKQNTWPAGLFALDVIFHLVRPAQAPVMNADNQVVREAPGHRREVLRSEIRLALLNTRLGGGLQKLMQRTREFMKARRSGRAPASATVVPGQSPAPAPRTGKLPAETNFKLLKSVEQVVKSGLPLLFVTADDPTKLADFDYTEDLLSRCAGRASHKRMFGTDHGFISGNGKSRVTECVLEWITTEFRDPTPKPKALVTV